MACIGICVLVSQYHCILVIHIHKINVFFMMAIFGGRYPVSVMSYM